MTTNHKADYHISQLEKAVVELEAVRAADLTQAERDRIAAVVRELTPLTRSV